LNHHLNNTILHLADTCLILAQRNSAWCGHGPVLEQDIALTNLALDTLGQARNFYQYAARLMNESGAHKEPVTEDSLAYLRTEREFKNLLVVEQPNGHWGQTVLRQYLFSQFQQLLFEQLQHSTDTQVAAIATKALKEIAYHVRWSSEWVVRLGDGTDESHTKMQDAVAALWPSTAELFAPADYESTAAASGEYVAVESLKEAWHAKVQAVFEEAILHLPTAAAWGAWMQGGKQGVHTEELGHILSDLQYLQRTYPNSEW
jgi:ring-1,2-phenylacetyl-CoA epoxidase subunit PaaC